MRRVQPRMTPLKSPSKALRNLFESLRKHPKALLIAYHSYTVAKKCRDKPEAGLHRHRHARGLGFGVQVVEPSLFSDFPKGVIACSSEARKVLLWESRRLLLTEKRMEALVVTSTRVLLPEPSGPLVHTPAKTFEP